ncbi:MAG: DUF1343 domain-containing protein [Armatimonadota bacterium]|nr:DUF1343 domain-containing protein [Armatimonadota bacterium]
MRSCIALVVIAAASLAAAAQGAPLPVAPGIDVFLADPAPARGRRIGLVTHRAAVTRDGRTTAAALIENTELRVTALFAPEHGIDGTFGAGEPVPNVRGPTPVYSLYGSTLRPTRQMLHGVDLLVIDLQDVGVRPYTYASTMSLVLEAARAARRPVVVLDRPNPLGGVTVDGPVLEPPFRSFIGPHPIPMVHGMTIGELARLFNDAFGIGAQLRVVPMEGWTRTMTWADTGLGWVNPSPGITSPQAPFYYAATGPIDGTNLWNGVGTSSRFQVVLAPWIPDGAQLAERLNRHRLPGVRFSASALPHPRTGRVWRGVRLHVTEPAAFRPATTTVYILCEIRDLYGDRLAFRVPPRGRALFDVVWGTQQVRSAIRRKDPPARIVARWEAGRHRFERLRERHLLYR